MMTCTKCGVEKEETNYQKYFHSTQNKWRVRKECTECLYKTRLKRKNPDLYYQSQPDYKKCKNCQEWKHIDDYYFHSKVTGVKFTECKICQNIKDRNIRERQLEMNGGSDRVISTPNEYVDKYQKEQTFFVLQLLGYTYNEDNGIWTKSGIKELIDGELVFPKIKKYKRPGRYDTKVTYQMVQQFIELKDRGWNSERIGNKFGVSDTTVFKYIKKWKDTSK
jgi:hypothetical protein